MSRNTRTRIGRNWVRVTSDIWSALLQDLSESWTRLIFNLQQQAKSKTLYECSTHLHWYPGWFSSINDIHIIIRTMILSCWFIPLAFSHLMIQYNWPFRETVISIGESQLTRRNVIFFLIRLYVCSWLSINKIPIDSFLRFALMHMVKRERASETRLK